MTIEQLLECSAAQLAAMSDDELLKHLQPYLHATRPEQAVSSRAHKVDKRKSTIQKEDDKFLDGQRQRMLALMEKKLGKDALKDLT